MQSNRAEAIQKGEDKNSHLSKGRKEKILFVLFQNQNNKVLEKTRYDTGFSCSL